MEAKITVILYGVIFSIFMLLLTYMLPMLMVWVYGIVAAGTIVLLGQKQFDHEPDNIKKRLALHPSRVVYMVLSSSIFILTLIWNNTDTYSEMINENRASTAAKQEQNRQEFLFKKATGMSKSEYRSLSGY